MQAAPSLRLDGARLVAEAAALMQDQGQQCNSLQLQRILKLVRLYISGGEARKKPPAGTSAAP